jgi:hypothetical protein
MDWGPLLKTRFCRELVSAEKFNFEIESLLILVSHYTPLLHSIFIHDCLLVELVVRVGGLNPCAFRLCLHLVPYGVIKT